MTDAARAVIKKCVARKGLGGTAYHIGKLSQLRKKSLSTTFPRVASETFDIGLC